MSDVLVEVRDLVHSYNGNDVLKIDKLSIFKRETLVVLGSTGSGKSTLLRILNLLESPKTGAVRWKDKVLNAKSIDQKARFEMVMAFQDSLLFKTTVFNNIAYGLRLRHVPKDQLKKRVDDMLSLFSIEHLAGRSAIDLSGGEAQRAALARALVVSPELLLLDEPLASLDPVTKERLAVDLQYVLDHLGTTCIYVTHSREEAFLMGDRIAVLEDGQIGQIGTPEEVFYHPQTATVASFVGTETMVKGRIDKQDNGLALISIDGGKIEAVTDYQQGETVTVCIRPEEVMIELTQPQSQRITGSARNHLSGIVTRVDIQGPIAKIHLDCGFPLKAMVTRRSWHDLALKKGMEVTASFKATSVHVIREDS